MGELKVERNNESGIEGIICIMIIIGIILFPIYIKIRNLWNYLSSLNLGIYLKVLLIVITLWVITHVLFKIITSLYQKRINYLFEKKSRLNLIKTEMAEVEELLSKAFLINERDLMKEIESLKRKIPLYEKYRELSKFVPELKKRIINGRNLLEELQRKRIIEEINRETERARKDLEEAKRQKEIGTMREKERIGRELEMYWNNIYIKKYMNKKQIEILKENGYKQINEYCVYEKKIITVLIKTEMNHSPTHEFLVWSTKRILEQIDGVDKIQDHLTKNADITFKFKNKKFALEIELGSLLRKKSQLRKKVEYLNENFKKKWMFIVSNRNLLQDYKKLGFSTQRNRMYENIYKLLQNAHPSKAGVKLIIPTIKCKTWHQNHALY